MSDAAPDTGPSERVRLANISPNSLGARITYKVGHTLVWLIFLAWNRISASGKENIPYGACIWAPVHRSYIDTPVQSAVPVRMRFMAKESMWKHRPLGWLFTVLGGFPVSRGVADRDAMRTALDALKNSNEPLVTFPEGGRRDGPRVHPLQPGAVYLAAKAQVPIVPVGIGGTADAMPRGARFIFPKRIRIVIGEPIAPLKLSPSGRVPRSEVSKATEQLRETIQQLFDEAQEYVGKPNKY